MPEKIRTTSRAGAGRGLFLVATVIDGSADDAR
jgi:hypothetical protein